MIISAGVTVGHDWEKIFSSKKIARVKMLFETHTHTYSVPVTLERAGVEGELILKKVWQVL